MTEQEMRLHSCCFTGHRPNKLTRAAREIQSDLEENIICAVNDGLSTFITGMAYGVDIWAGEIVVRLRKSNPNLSLIAAVPFPGFESHWSDEWKRSYNQLLIEADSVHFICPSYKRYAFQRRNAWMVDHSSRVIAVYDGLASGTKNTIDYANRVGVPVVIING